MKRLLINDAFPRFPDGLKTALAEQGRCRAYHRNDILQASGEQLKHVTLILNGCVELVRDQEEAGEFALGFLGKGQSFGMSVSDDSPDRHKTSTMTFRAIEPTDAFHISFDLKDRLARQYDEWYKYILQSSVQYYWALLDLIDSIAFQQLDTRIEDYLRRLAVALNTRCLEITHLELAGALNARRETVSRLLKKMQENGKLEMRQNRIILL